MKKLLVKGLLLGLSMVSLVGCGKEVSTNTDTEVKVYTERVYEEQTSVKATYEDGKKFLEESVSAGFDDFNIIFDEDAKIYFIYVPLYEKDVFNSVMAEVEKGNISKETLKETIGWYDLKAAQNEASENSLEGLYNIGLTDVHVAIAATDETGEIIYLASMDGITIYDVFE